MHKHELLIAITFNPITYTQLAAPDQMKKSWVIVVHVATLTSALRKDDVVQEHIHIVF